MDEIDQAIDQLGLSGRVLLMHTSMRSFGDGAPTAEELCGALLAHDCTVVVPTFTGQYAVDAPAGLGYEFNNLGEIGAQPGSPHPYDSTTSEVDPDMGAFPQYVASRSDRVRGGHPLNSFAAVGPLASLVVGRPDLHDVYAPIKRVVELQGTVFLCGVAYWSMTLLHLAEQNSGRTLFRRWALDPVAQVQEVEVGSCSAGFQKFSAVLSPLARRATVGSSRWKALDARAALIEATNALKANPQLAFCDNPTCQRCSDQRAGGPVRRQIP